MAFTIEQVQAQIDARIVKRNINRLASLCLETGVDFEVQHKSSLVIIHGLQMGKSGYFKAIADREASYMQSGRQLTLDDIAHMINAERPLLPAFAYNYAQED